MFSASDQRLRRLLLQARAGADHPEFRFESGRSWTALSHRRKMKASAGGLVGASRRTVDLARRAEPESRCRRSPPASVSFPSQHALPSLVHITHLLREEGVKQAAVSIDADRAKRRPAPYAVGKQCQVMPSHYAALEHRIPDLERALQRRHDGICKSQSCGVFFTNMPERLPIDCDQVKHARPFDPAHGTVRPKACASRSVRPSMVSGICSSRRGEGSITESGSRLIVGSRNEAAIDRAATGVVPPESPRSQPPSASNSD